MKLVLHVGLHKTGTSYLQSIFTSNKRVLADNNILYPPTPGDAHHKLAALYKARKFYDAKSLLDSYVKEAEERNCHTIFLSSEVFSELEDYKPIKEGFSCFKDVKVIIFLREPLSLYLSAFNQLVREPGVRRKKKIQEGNVYNLDFRERVQLWKSAFPEGEIEIYNYDAEKKREGGLKTSFLDSLGISGFQEVEVGSVNKSYGVVATEILRIANILEVTDESFAILKKRLSGEVVLNELFESVCLLEKIDVEKICNHYVPVFNSVLREYGKDVVSLEETLQYHLKKHVTIKSLHFIVISSLVSLLDEDVSNDMVQRALRL